MEFRLSDSFLAKYKETQPSWGPLGEFVFLRTYSRKIEEENRNELWWETVKRIVEGTYTIQKNHCESLKLAWNNTKSHRSAEKMYDKIFNFKFLPSGRGLWMMGTDFVTQKGSAALNNCAMISSGDIDIRGSFMFTWTMDALMLGVGVGFDTKGAGKITIKQPKPDGIFIIQDTRESWVESLGILLDSFFYGRPLPTFDYSLIRPYGEPIRGFGGIASGPDPLRKMHENIYTLMLNNIGNKLTSVNIVDIINLISVCVISGNVRRSACIALGDFNDEAYVTMKDYNKNPEEVKSHRWASNNSVFAEVGKTDYNQFVESIALNGEPGIVWLENCQKYSRLEDAPDWKDIDVVGVNPCGEQSLENGELCCLAETFPSLHESINEYKETLKYTYLYAKTVTLLATHWPETNAVLLKNRRIGLSQSGIQDAFVKHGRRTILEWDDICYKYIQDLDKMYSNWLCVPRSKKTTSVKPSGSVSLLPGVSAGIHYPHAEFYIRRVRVAKSSLIVEIMRSAGYEIEIDANDSNTAIVNFPVWEKYFKKKKSEVSMWNQVKDVVDIQRWWADNNVSVTITFKEEEKKDIVRLLECYEDSLKAISFLPLVDHGYAQAPYEEISKEKYESMISKITIPNFSLITNTPIGSKFCDGDSCTL
jgi:ribonucleoside-triphosphate reductase